MLSDRSHHEVYFKFSFFEYLLSFSKILRSLVFMILELRVSKLILVLDSWLVGGYAVQLWVMVLVGAIG